MHFTLEKEVLLLGAGTITILVSFFIRRKLPSLFKDRIRNEEQNYYHSFFTTIENAKCRPHVNARQACSEVCSYALLQKICKFLASAESTISLCMYTASLDSVYEELQAAYKRGVRVRIITDFEMTRLNSTIFNAFAGTGVKVKTPGDVSNCLMHHKFCLVDENDATKGKLFSGSLNLTMQGICGNFEHVLFTNDRDFINRFSEEFEYLWDRLS